MPVKAGYLIAAGGGALLLWSGIKGHRWSTVLRSVVSGKPISTTEELAIQTSPAAFSGGSGTGPATPNLGVGGSQAKNKAIGAALATAYGWGPGTSNWSSLVTLWAGESGWDNRAKNPSSGAYGIPQALPANKMGTLANPPLSSASAQISWGLKYIKDTYGSPDAALSAWQSRSPHWY
jgi:hypothetical protein